MLEILASAEQSFLSEVLAFILATSIIGVYHCFFRAYTILLKKLHLYLHNGSHEHLRAGR